MFYQKAARTRRPIPPYMSLATNVRVLQPWKRSFGIRCGHGDIPPPPFYCVFIVLWESYEFLEDVVGGYFCTKGTDCARVCGHLGYQREWHTDLDKNGQVWRHRYATYLMNVADEFDISMFYLPTNYSCGLFLWVDRGKSTLPCNQDNSTKIEKMKIIIAGKYFS